MIVNEQVGKTSVKDRVDYLLHGTKGNREPSKVDILEGNSELFESLARNNPYKAKTYNYLISFEESKPELEQKLKAQGKTIEDVYQEVFSFLLPAEYYPREGLNTLAVGHADTDNYHIHLTVENRDYKNDKSLYVPVNNNEAEFHEVLGQYISAKYGLEMGKPQLMSKGGAGVEKIKAAIKERDKKRKERDKGKGKDKYRNLTRDQEKKDITEWLTGLIAAGEIETREDLIAYLLTMEGVKQISRVGKNYISLEFSDRKRKNLRLKGGIYAAGRFEKLKQYIRTDKAEKPTFEEAGRVLERTMRKREFYIAKRQRPIPKRDEKPNTGVVREPLRPDRGLNREQQNLVENNLRSIDNSLYSDDWLAGVHTLQAGESPAPAPSKHHSSSLQNGTRPRQELVEDGEPSRRLGMQGEGEREDRMAGLQPNSYTRAKIRMAIAMSKAIEKLRKQELDYLKNIEPEKVLGALGISFQEKDGYLLMELPFKEGNSTSFGVFYAGAKGCWVYHDFSTGREGSSIDLWQAVRKLSCVEAVKDMRETFGLGLLERGDLNRMKERLANRIQAEQKRQAEKRKMFNGLKVPKHKVMDVDTAEHYQKREDKGNDNGMGMEP